MQIFSKDNVYVYVQMYERFSYFVHASDSIALFCPITTSADWPTKSCSLLLIKGSAEVERGRDCAEDIGADLVEVVFEMVLQSTLIFFFICITGTDVEVEVELEAALPPKEKEVVAAGHPNPTVVTPSFADEVVAEDDEDDVFSSS